MRGLILAAGEESRLTPSSALPTLFRKVRGRTLLEWQLDTLEALCDDVMVILGHGFVNCTSGRPGPLEKNGSFEGDILIRQNRFTDPSPDIDKEKIRRWLATTHDIPVHAVVVPHWEECGTAEYGRLGLRETAGDALVLAGNLLYRDYVVKTLVAEFDARLSRGGWSVVAVEPGIRRGKLAVRWDHERKINAVGTIPGYGIAGMFLVREEHVPIACEVLKSDHAVNFPALFTSIESTYLPIPPESRIAIDSPDGYRDAKRTVAGWAGNPAEQDSSTG